MAWKEGGKGRKYTTPYPWKRKSYSDVLPKKNHTHTELKRYARPWLPWKDCKASKKIKIKKINKAGTAENHLAQKDSIPSLDIAGHDFSSADNRLVGSLSPGACTEPRTCGLGTLHILSPSDLLAPCKVKLALLLDGRWVLCQPRRAGNAPPCYPLEPALKGNNSGNQNKHSRPGQDTRRKPRKRAKCGLEEERRCSVTLNARRKISQQFFPQFLEDTSLVTHTFQIS